MTASDPATPRLLNIAEAAAYLNIPAATLRGKVTQRKVPFTRIGRHVRFTPQHLAAIIAAGEQPALRGPLGRPRASGVSPRIADSRYGVRRTETVPRGPGS